MTNNVNTNKNLYLYKSEILILGRKKVHSYATWDFPKTK